jgi:hypothetical protein
MREAAAMPKIESRDHDAGAEPAPRFATGAEIELAEKLRIQLEKRYLGSSAASSPMPAQLGEGN